MFLHVLFPLADARPFVDEDDRRLLTPSWPDPNPAGEFGRYFGHAGYRPRGGTPDWDGEATFVNARRALRVRGLGRGPDRGAGFEGRYRRLFFDGRASARVIVGLHAIAQTTVAAAVDGALALRTDVPGPKVRAGSERRATENYTLGRAGDALAMLFFASTTAAPKESPREREAFRWSFVRERRWWVSAGDPVLVVEVPRDQATAAARETSWLLERGDSRIAVAHAWMLRGSLRARVWIVVHEAEQADLARRLRLNLLRIHAEQETIRVVMRLLASRRVSMDRRGPSSDALQAFLNDALHLVQRTERHGMPNSELFRRAAHYEDIVNAAQHAELERQLAKIRPNVAKKVEGFLLDSRSARARDPGAATGDGNIVVNLFPEVKDMSTINITGSTIHGNVTAAQNISDSFNQIQKIQSEPLKEAVKTLADRVAAGSKSMTPESAEKASKNLKALSTEAAAEKPDRAWYEISAKGLVEAADTLGDLAEPIVTAVKAVLALLG